MICENKIMKLNVMLFVAIFFMMEVLCNDVIDDKQFKYSLVYKHTNILMDVAKEFIKLNKNISDIGNFEIVGINNTEKEKSFLCFTPKHNETKTKIENEIEVNYEDSQAIKKLTNLIVKSFMNVKCIFSLGINEGYWTYVYCHDDRVLQFHGNINLFLVSGKNLLKSSNLFFVLGRFNNSGTWLSQDKQKFESDYFVKNASDYYVNSKSNEYNTNAKVLVREITNGDICDLTKKPRSVTVIFHCNSNDKDIAEISDVQEIETCKYQMIVNVPELCSVKDFSYMKKLEKKSEIICKRINPLISENIKTVYLTDFFKYNEILNYNTKFFPDLNNYKINLEDYILNPCGSGFYFGLKKDKIKNSISHLKSRNIFIYTGLYNSHDDLLQKFHDMYIKVLEIKIPSPLIYDSNAYYVLTWSDTFIAWYELYDFYGNFFSMVRISLLDPKKKELNIEFVDPANMKTKNGTTIFVNEYTFYENELNFEFFNRNDNRLYTSQFIEKEEKLHDQMEDVNILSKENTTSLLNSESNLIGKFAAKLNLTFNQIQTVLIDLNLKLEETKKMKEENNSTSIKTFRIIED